MFRRKSTKKAAAAVVKADIAPPVPSPAQVLLAATQPPPPATPSKSRHGDGAILPIKLPPSDDGEVRRSSSSVRAGKARVTASGPASFHKPTAYAIPPDATVPRSQSNPEGFVRYQEFTSTTHTPQPPLAPGQSPYGTFAASPGGRHSSSFSIASLYPSPSAALTPPTPELPPISTMPKSASLPNVRRSQRVPPTFNLICVGAKKTGKTALVKTLLANLSLAGTVEDRARADRFGLVSARQEPKVARTTRAQAVSIDVQGRGDKFNLTVIDTVGLDIPMSEARVGDELDVERQMSGILRTIEARFDETLKSENLVFRHSHRAHDSHIHLALYLIHPESIAPRPPPRKIKTSLGSLNFRASQSTPSLANAGTRVGPGADKPDSAPVSPTWEDEGEPTMNEIDLRCIKKLSRRVNVLPVIARADELTKARLAELKAVVKRDLSRAGLDFGTFAPTLAPPLGIDGDDEPRRRVRTDSQTTQGSSRKQSSEESVEEEPVRLGRFRSMSRGALSRNGVNRRGDDEDDGEREDVAHLLPFALMAPETFVPDKDGNVKFQREFRFGTLDVLNPDHSDFIPLRDTLFGPQMRLLKEATRLEKYEPFRTQRLLAKRGTRVLSDEAKNNILKDLANI
ncbi:hypothetical protein RQP46_002846 [Phenoliferia psychrophenolica]